MYNQRERWRCESVRRYRDVAQFSAYDLHNTTKLKIDPCLMENINSIHMIVYALEFKCDK